ncbi:hypothetical protein Bca4012_056094 [Brassica carinata]
MLLFHSKEKSKLIEGAHSGIFIKELNKNWKEHNKALEMIRDILMYMDRTYVESTKNLHVHAMGLSLWRDHVMHSSKIRVFLRTILLRGSPQFYKVESQEFIESCDCGDYLKKAEKRLSEEIDRVGHYLDAKTEDKITSVVEKEMIANHMQRLVHMENSDLVNILLNDKYEDSGKRGSNWLLIRKRHQDPVEFVQRLLDERDKYDKIISIAFGNDKTFQNALNFSFQYFINLNARFPPEFISLFVDDKLWKGLKGVVDVDVEIVLDKVIMMFRYLQEKDVFEKYYKQHLAKRLLSGKTVSDDAERSLIN